MDRSIFLAALALLSAGGACAQSSVTVYGRLNTTVERMRINSQTVYRLNDNASRIGLRGAESLVGGLKASFLVEHGFNTDTGAQTGAAFWGRESWVALGGSFGRTRLGNMGATSAYYTVADYIGLHNHDTGTSADFFYLHPGTASNMVAYTSPNLNGLVLDLQIGLSESSQQGRTHVLTASYDAGALHLGASYLEARSSLSSPHPKELGLRVLYEFGDFTLGGYYIRNKDTFRSGSSRNAWRGSVMHALGAGEVHVNVGYAAKVRNFGIRDDDAKQYTVGYNHNLSKRTKAYTYYSRVDDSASNLYGGDFSTFAVGVRHNF